MQRATWPMAMSLGGSSLVSLEVTSSEIAAAAVSPARAGDADGGVAGEDERDDRRAERDDG